MSLFSTNKTFVIAEMANSHEGSLTKAKEIVKAACFAKADAIKFQKFRVTDLLSKDHEKFSHFKNLEMTNKEWKELIKFTKRRKIKIFVDVFDISSAKDVVKMNVDGLKIHSTDISNPYLLKFISSQKLPLLLSTAGCYPNEVDEALQILMKTKKEIVLMHGFQGFPTRLEDTNLLRILEIKNRFGFPVGLMDHISGSLKMVSIIPLLGIGLGAVVIEKHITLDRNKKGIDYYSALNPDEFKELVSLIRLTEKSLGKKNFILAKNELTYRLTQKKNAIAKKTINKNTKLYDNLFSFKRTEVKRESVSFYNFENRFSSQKIPKGKILIPSMIKNGNIRIAAVIACRVESNRLFGKPLQNIGETSILNFLIKQIKTAKLIDEIVLAVSERLGNEIFIDFAKKNNIKFVLGDDRDVLQRLIDGAKYVNANIIFRVTSENPYIYWERIDNLIKKHITGKFDFSFLKNVPLGSGYEIINLEAFEKSHKYGMKKHRSELCSLYIYEHKNQFKIQSYDPPPKLAKPSIRLTVDTIQDLLVARTIYENLCKNGNPIPLAKVINFLEKNPQIAQINSSIPLDVARIWD